MTHEILSAAQKVYAQNNAIHLATSGGAYSPWILGAYFTHEDQDLLLLLEERGKTMQNLKAQQRIAFLVTTGDAQEDFVQGSADALLLPMEEEPRVRALLLEKMPWFQTFTPCLPVRLKPRELFVSSLSRGWFPARRHDFTAEPAPSLSL